MDATVGREGRELVREAADVVRALIASIYLGSTAVVSKLGTVVLREHQVEAVRRLRALLHASSGALLADEVGLGKTFVALALAVDATNPLIVAPASLLPMWKSSAESAGVHSATFVSHEALSRDRSGSPGHDMVIIDEAHHARNPAALRYGALAKLCAGARVLLISATPVHNSERDLRALFALFLGSRAWTCCLDELTRIIVRREQRALHAVSLPVARAPQWLPMSHADDLLNAIVGLPPPLPPSDGGDGGAFVTHGLIRQWTSSDAALVGALVRRRARAVALIAALEGGRYPTLGELRAWSHTEDSVQLAFPELVQPTVADTAMLLPSVRSHDAAITRLLTRLRASDDSDRQRAARLLDLRTRHHGARIVAFTQFADTAHGLFRLVAPHGGAAVLTARGALTVGGKLSRAEALACFSSASTATANRIDFLLATDLLSEGIDLPEVSVVVHLDLPWTPARLEQRVGRAVRLTSRHGDIHVYCMSPPASAAALLQVDSILRRKASDAGRTIGVSGMILPSIGAEPTPTPSPAAQEESIRARMATWLPSASVTLEGRAPGTQSLKRREVLYSCVASETNGWMALLRDTERPILLACLEGRVTNQASDIARVLPHCERPEHHAACIRSASGAHAGATTVDPPSELRRALEQIDDWIRHRHGASSAGLSISSGTRWGARLLQRIGSIARRAPFHRRGAIATLAVQARRAVTARRGIGAERVLAELVHSSLNDDAWLRAVGAFADLNATPDAGSNPQTDLVALLLLHPH